SLWQRHRRPRPQSPFAATTPPHRQSFLAIQPEQLLVVQPKPLASQQDVQPPITEPPPLGRQRPKPSAHRSVITTAPNVAKHLRRHAQERTRTPLRVTLLADRPAHGFAPRTGRQKFFPRA